MLQEHTVITTSELIRKLNNNRVKLIDIRPVDAYNGWKPGNESREGHIKGAKSLPYKWTKYIDWIEMVRHKNIQPSDEIIIYGYEKEEIKTVADSFLKFGYKNISLYLNFTDEWATDDSLPMVHLKRYQNLVSAQWVNRLISGEKPEHYTNTRYKVIHAHYRNRDAYLTGHIPGAIDMDTLAVEAPETWNRRSPEELKATFEQHGITSDTTVVVYGKFMYPDNNDPFPGSAAGDIGAIRIAFIMLYAGVKDVRILNGGFQAWTDEGFEVSYTDEPKIPVPDFGSAIPVHPELAVDTPEAKEILAATNAELVCVRSWPEYIGEVSGYNYIEPKGRIPGAVFADCGSDAYHMENYRNFDHTTREFHETADIWINRGITPDKHLAFYCGTGWRGSEAWFNAWLMGWPNVSVYDGGWFEWSSDPSNPFETGIPEEYLITNKL
ncbi:rhodanese-like domain-containing protein [Saccharicrinis sp. FJH62]|uniref:rhodanese-like domain-containing protein n=1 Tax=Saccharicrinis sp. FJH62 TaxID=3344657 RepID=UPI0035D44F2B